MSSGLLNNPKLFRHLVEDLPFGIYIVDGERRICFWNHGAERITGHLAHEVVGHILDDVVHTCDQDGNRLSGEQLPVRMTLQEREARQCTVSYLHKGGHRVAVKIRTRPIVEYGEYGDTIGGASVLFEEALADREQSSEPPMYGCLDATTGIPSRRLTRAVVNECIAGTEESHLGFGVVRIRVLGLEEFRVETRSPIGGAFSAHSGAHAAAQPGAGEFPGLLGRKRISGGTALGESCNRGNDGGKPVTAAERFGSFVVGRPFPDSGRGGTHRGHRRQRPGSRSWRDETRALAGDEGSASAAGDSGRLRG